MTIEYKDSKRITALSTDIVEQPTLEDDFTTYANTTEGDAVYVPSVTGTNETRVNPSTDVIDCRFEDNSADHHFAYRDLTGAVISEHIWILRAKISTSSITQPTGGLSHSIYIGISDNTSNFATSQNFLGLSLWNGGASATPSSSQYYAVARNSAIGGFSTSTTAQLFTTNWTNTDTYYVEIIRVNHTTLTVELFSDSAYTTSVEKQTLTFATGITGLRYFKAGVYDNANIVGFTITIDDLEFYNGTANKPSNVQDNSLLVEKDTANRYWFSEATPTTFENDFGTTSDWTKVGTTITVNDHVSGKCSINDPANSSSDRVYKSLGATLSDTAWVATCEINISAISGSERAFPVQFSSTTGSYRSSHDSIAIRLGGDLSGSSPSIGMSRNDGGTVIHLTDANSIQVSTGTLYYVKIWRDGSDLKLAVYTNSDYETGQVGSTQTHQSLGSPTGLSNVVIGSDDASTGGVNATVDNLKVYNNVTTTTPATWTNEDIFTDDYSSNSGWTSVGSNTTVNSAVAGKVHMTGDIDNWVYKDLGFNLKSKWIARGNIKATTYGSTGRSLVPVTFIDDPTIHPKNGTGNNGIGVFMDTTGGTRYFWLSIITNGSYDRGTNDANHRISFVVGTTYYYELIRDGSTLTLRITTNSDFSGGSVITRTTTLLSNTFRYLVHGTDVATSSSNTVEADDTVVHNGVTSIN